MQWALRILAFFALLSLPAAAQEPRRIALVMGNAAYTTQGWALTNPVNDATLMASRLRDLGFDVDPVYDATKAQMETAFQRFGERLKAAGPDAIGLFYYAGHGAQKDGVNLLVPVDVTARTMDQLRYQAPAMQFLLDDMGEAGNAVNIIILDACRDTPLLDGHRSGPGRGGFAELSEPPPDVLIAYATRAGYTASDNSGDTNSVFTRTLAEAFKRQSGEPLELLFSDVGAQVFAITGGAQRPEFRSGLVRAPRWSLRPGGPRDGATPITVTAPVAIPGPRPTGQSFDDCAGAAWCPRMIAVPVGSFTMGSPASEPARADSEGPAHTVTLGPFAAGKFEVTLAQWRACVAGGGCQSNPTPDQSGFSGDDVPVVNVSWDDAREYVDWINTKVPGAPYRLLTEAEWEYAARAGSSGAFSFGPSPAPGKAVYNWTTSYNGSSTRANKPSQPSAVGKFPANAFGLHDMHGNVFEWVEDCFQPTYAGAPANGAAAITPACQQHVVRGGAWYSRAENTRAAFREPKPANWRNNGLGFRVARSLR